MFSTGRYSLEFSAYSSSRHSWAAPAAVTTFGEVYMPLDGLIDMDAEKSRLDKEIAKITKEVEKAGKKLSNPNFIERAKPEVVDVERARLAEWEGKLEQLRSMRGALA